MENKTVAAPAEIFRKRPKNKKTPTKSSHQGRTKAIGRKKRGGIKL
jgi:hypothetical protein